MKILDTKYEPAILDFYFDELEDIKIEEVFNHSSGSKLDYGDLVVYDGRKTIPDTSAMFSKVDSILKPPIIKIAKTLLSMDKKRYPSFHIDDFFKKLRIGILITIDEPGFSQPWHLDNRFIALSGVINAQDNITRTHFSKENYHWASGGTDFSDCEIIHKGQCKKYTGTAWLNTELTWHCVPRVSELRKILLFNVFFY